MKPSQPTSKSMKNSRTRKTSRALAGSIAALLAVQAAAPSAQAVIYYWDGDDLTPGFGTASGIWAAPTIGTLTSGWSTDPTGATVVDANSVTTTTTDALNFGNGATGLAAGTITVSGTVDAGDLTFASGSGAIVLSGGTINLAAVATITVDNAADTISSVLTGAATSLTKLGTGTLTLSGVNTYTGTTTISAGTLTIDDGSIASSSGIVNNAALVYNLNVNARTYANVISGTGTLTKSGTNTLTLTGVNTYTGVTTISGGTLTIDDGSIASSSGIVNSAALVYNLNANARTYANVISGTGTLTKSGTNSLTLTGTNTFTGQLTVQNGTLGIATINNVSAAGPLGNSALAVILGNTGAQTGTLSYTGATATSSKPFTMATGGTGAFDVTTGGTNLTLSAVIGGGGGLTKNGPGTLTLSAFNPFTGPITINSGTLEFSATGLGTLYGSTQININGASILRISSTVNNQDIYNGRNYTFDATGGGQILVSSGNYNAVSTPFSITTLGGARDTVGLIGTSGAFGFNLGSTTATFNVALGSDATSDLTVTPIIANTGSILKTGAGRLTLSGVNTYSGTTTINGGTLIANATAAIGSGAASNTLIFNGGTLQAAGTITSPAARGVTMTGAGTINTSSNSVTIAGVISGAGSLTKLGSGQLVLSAANPSFSGGVTIKAGDVNSTLANSMGTAAVTIGDSANTGLAATWSSSSGNVTYTNTISTAGTGTNTIGVYGFNPIYQGAISLASNLTILTNNNSGSTISSTGGITGTGNLTIQSNAASAALASGITFSGTALNFTGSITNNGITTGTNANTTISANIGSNVGLITQSSVNSALTLSGTNTNTAGVTLSNGTLNVNSATALGSGTFTWTNGTLNNSTAGAITLTNNPAITLTSNGTVFAGTQSLNFGTGNITLSAAPTINVVASTLTLGGSIQATANGLTKSGAGTLALSGANSYSGGTTLSAGTVVISNATSLGSGAVTVSGTSQITATGGITYANAINVGSQTLTMLNPATGSSSTATFSGILSGSGTISLPNSGANAIQGILAFTNTGNTFTGNVNLSASGSGDEHFQFNSIGDGGNFTFAKNGNRQLMTYTGSSNILFGTRQIVVASTMANGNGGTDRQGMDGGGSNPVSMFANDGSGTVSFSQNMSVGAIAAGTYGVLYFGGTNLGDNTFSGNIGDPSGTAQLAIGKFGTGKWIFSGSNTYEANTLIAGGTLSVGTIANASTPQPLGIGSGIQLGAGNGGASGTLQYTGGAASTNKQVVIGTLTAAQAAAGSILNDGTGALTFTNSTFNPTSTSYVIPGSGTALPVNVSVTRTLTLGGSYTGGTNVIQGVIQNNATATNGFVAITKTGAGTWALTGANTYSGTTTIGAGTLNANAGTALGNSSSTNTLIFTGGTLQAGGTVTSISTRLVTLTSTGLFDTNGNSMAIAGVMSGAGGVTKSGLGALTLSGTNTYTGNTTISAGTIVAQNASALGTGAGRNVSVAGGAGLNYSAAADANLSITGTLGITGGAGSVIGGSIGSTATGAQIAVTGDATATGAIGVNVYGISGATPLAGTNIYTLVNGVGAGSTMNGGGYTLGTVFNNTNFTVGALSSTTANLNVSITSATALTSAFWTGGLTGATNVWAASDGVANSNWVTTAGGGATGVVPGVGADVNISATSITTVPTATVLGANMTIKSLTLADTTNGLGLVDDGNILTITPLSSAVGITMNATVPTSTIAARVALGAAQTWTNNSANNLTFSGSISGTGAMTKAGTGTIILSGVNTYTGATGISAGTLSLTGALTGGTAISTSGTGILNQSATGIISGASSLIQGSSTTSTLAGASTYTGTTTVNAGTLLLNTLTANAFTSAITVNNGGTLSLGGANKIVDSAVVTVNTGGIWNLNGNAETIARTAGSGSVTNTGSLVSLVMTGGGTNTVGNVFSGAINFSIQGTATLTLTGASTYSGSTTIGAGGVAGSRVNLGVTNALPIGTAVTMETSSGAVGLDLAGFDQTLGLLTVGTNNGGANATVTGSGSSRLTLTAGATLNGHNNGAGLISVPFLDLNGTTQTLSITGSNNATSNLTVSSVIQNGALTYNGGTSTAGALILSGANTYSGATTNNFGVIRLGNNLALRNSAINTAGVGTYTLDATITTPTFGGLNGSKALLTTLINTAGYNLMTALTLNPGPGVTHTYSGVIANSTAGLSLTKTGLGTQILSNTNTYAGGTNVNAGILLLSGAFNMPATGTLAVNTGGTFSLADGTARTTTGASGVGLTLATGSNLAFDWNGASRDTLAIAGTATSAGTVGITINNTSPTGAGGNLITATGASTLSTANYFLANNINFTATLSKTLTTVSIGAQSAATPLTNAYWLGNLVTGATGAMALSSGTTSNWASAAAGTPAGGVVPSGSAVNVIFGATGAALQASVTTGAALNLGSITFNDTAAVTIAGSNVITLNSTSGTAAATTAALDTVTAGSAISVTSFANATNTISAPVALGANQTWNVASGKTLAVSGIVTGASVLTKDDAGTLLLSSANTFTGITNINAGTLRIGNATSLGTQTGATDRTIIASGATLDLGGVVLGANNEFITASGAGVGGNGAITSSGVIPNPFIGVRFLTLAADTTLGFTNRWDVGNNSTGGTLTGGGFTLNLVGSGIPAQASFNGLGETDLGDININLGSDANNIVYLQGNTTLGQTAKTVTISGGTTLNFFSSATLTSYDKKFALNTGNITVTKTGSMALPGTISLTGTNIITANAATVAITASGIISGIGGGLTKAGAGSLTLTNSNTYDGATTISAGAIVLSGSGTLGTAVAGTTVASAASLGLSGAGSFGSGETLTISGGGVTPANLFFSGSATQRGALQSTSGSNTYAGNIQLGVNGTTRIGTQNGAQLTITGTITQAFGVTTANILFRPGDTVGDFVTLSGTGNSFGGDSTVFTNVTTGNWAGVRLGVNNGLPTNLTISGLVGTGAGTALDLAGFDQTLNGLITGAAGMSIINMNTGTPSKLTLNPTADQASSNTLILGGGGLEVINLVKDGAFTQTLSGANTYTGVTTLTDGVLSVAVIGNGGVASGNLGSATNAAANLVFDGGTLRYTGTTASSDRNFTINAAKTATIDVSTGASTLTLSGASTATNGALTKTGAGTLTLTGVNTYPGATTIGAGTLNANSTAALGDETNAGNTLIFTGGTLQAGGAITSAATRLVTLTSTGLIDTNGSAVSIAGIMSGAGGLTKSGASTLTLSGANTYTGATSVTAGTLVAANAAALGDVAAGTTVTSGATLDVQANISTEAITVGGTGVGGTGALITSTGTGTVGGAVALTANTTLGGAAALNINGAVTGGFSITKVGGGVTSFGPIGGGGSLAAVDDLTAQGGTTNVNSVLGGGTSDVSVTGAGTKLKFGSVSQTLTSLTIGAGSTVTFTSGLASGAFSGGGGGKAPSLGGSAVVPEPGTIGLLLVGALGMLNRRRRQA